MDAPVSQLSSPLLTSDGHTVKLFGVVRLKKERKVFFRVLDMSDGVIGSCGNEGRGGAEGDIFRRDLEVAALQGIMGRKRNGQGSSSCP